MSIFNKYKIIMNIELIKTLINYGKFKNPYIFSITFEDVYGALMWRATLTPEAKRGFGYHISRDHSYDLDCIITELQQFSDECSDLNLVAPTDEDQKCNNGYCSTKISDNKYVEWKRMDDRFYVISIYDKDDAGFVLLKTPVSISEYPNAQPFSELVRIEHYNYPSYEEKIFSKLKLENGESLWCWDTIQVLSGRAGLIIVKDGMVTKVQTLRMA